MSYQIIIDFGLVILIWMVQLVVYPSFHFFDDTGLSRWHPKYTVMITVIVMPLMFSQVAFHAVGIWQQPSMLRIIQAGMISGAWGVTFFRAVPLHAQIDRNENTSECIKSLVWWNWPRTVLWSAVFLMDLL